MNPWLFSECPQPPLVHCVTNYVTVNDCANLLLACGAAPVMADEPEEVGEITALADALVLNLGTLNTHTISAMKLAKKAADRKGIPTVLDPVGIGASRLRADTALALSASPGGPEDRPLTVIRGNLSEIRCLALRGSEREQRISRGVDASVGDEITPENRFGIARMAQRLAAATGSIIAISGQIDVVTDGLRGYFLFNGDPLMQRITGTGCMLTALVGALVGGGGLPPLDATARAFGLMGLAGQRALCALRKSGTRFGNTIYRDAILTEIAHITRDEYVIGEQHEPFGRLPGDTP